MHGKVNSNRDEASGGGQCAQVSFVLAIKDFLFSLFDGDESRTFVG